MKSFRNKPVGWKYESVRHSLAAKGIKTRYFAYGVLEAQHPMKRENDAEEFSLAVRAFMRRFAESYGVGYPELLNHPKFSDAQSEFMLRYWQEHPQNRATIGAAVSKNWGTLSPEEKKEVTDANVERLQNWWRDLPEDEKQALGQKRSEYRFRNWREMDPVVRAQRIAVMKMGESAARSDPEKFAQWKKNIAAGGRKMYEEMSDEEKEQNLENLKNARAAAAEKWNRMSGDERAAQLKPAQEGKMQWHAEHPADPVNAQFNEVLSRMKITYRTPTVGQLHVMSDSPEEYLAKKRVLQKVERGDA